MIHHWEQTKTTNMEGYVSLTSFKRHSQILTVLLPLSTPTTYTLLLCYPSMLVVHTRWGHTVLLPATSMPGQLKGAGHQLSPCIVHSDERTVHGLCNLGMANQFKFLYSQWGLVPWLNPEIVTSDNAIINELDNPTFANPLMVMSSEINFNPVMYVS